MAQRLLTPKGQELVNSNRPLKHWSAPGTGGTPYKFVGDFYHNGVDLEANEVLNIMAQQVGTRVMGLLCGTV